MNLRELFESTHTKVTAAFCFGRFNPPHQGHAKVWEAVKHAGHQWYIGTNPSTTGHNDPLPFDVKAAWMSAIDPSIEGHVLGESTVITLASKIYAEVGDGATVAYITDATDWAWAGKLLNQYNGKESTHGYFNFAKIIHIPSPRVSSATDLRNAARAGNMDAFYRAAGTDPNLEVNGQHYFDTVVAAVGQHPEKVKRAKKEKPVAEPVTDEGLMGFMTKPVKAKPTTSAEEMRKYFEKEKAKDPDKMERGEGHKKPQQVYTKTDEEAAGVGTITKQNSTVDVNSSTPKKNLKAFNLIKEANRVLREMKANEFVREGKTSHRHPHHDAASLGVIRTRDIGGYDRIYHMNRMMMAMAMADGESIKAVDSPQDTWAEKYNTHHPYTKEDDNKIRSAMKTVPTDGKIISKFSKSEEPADTNKTSPVNKAKRNKYGI